MSEPVQLELPLEDTSVDSRLPVPRGYRVLIKVPEVEETFGTSGIIKVSTTKNHDNILTMVGEVISMGEQAYNDYDRFSTGPWCAVGDYVMFRANTGTRFKIDDVEYRLMNDDSIEAVVPDPKAITRAS